MAPAPVNDTEPTIGKLVADVTGDFSALARQEIQLLKSELKLSVKAGGFGLAFFAVAGFLALMSLILGSVALAHLIHWNGAGLSLHWAYLIVTGLYLAAAALCGFLGYRYVKRISAPTESVEQLQLSKQAITGGPAL
ncbi:phage holin family protein [Nocardioides limicola]|uniref:phage holin family protein n=1 Tax=Nocardioides limicola TaxID=2803368 RepID=UPI00193C7AE1|nr:phage holin family protein [Nocardioides sp. DJM-14]